MQTSVLTISLLAALGSVAAAAPPSLRTASTPGDRVQAPIFGYAGVASGAVQPIFGIRGSLLRGASLDLAGARAAVSPTQEYALLAGAEGGEVQILMLAAGTAQPLAGAWGDADQIVYNGNGTAALLYSAARQAAQLVTGLPANPQLGSSLTIASAGTVHLALTDDAAFIALASDAGLQLLGADGSIKAQGSVGTGSLAQFLPQSADLLTADPQSGSLSRWHWQDGQFTAAPLLAGDAALSAPAALAVSADGARYWVANGDGQVLEWLPGSQTRSVFDCGCQPASLSALRQASSPSALLAAGDSSGIWLLDTASGAARLTYVPANQGGQQ